ncbi:hypothetical protein [Methanofollis fontis]|uniref:Uncharacterized protein n=1 Tax=Methanofollis fontis TaxID=2052832 RepID=A0A483CMA3_9EURY|nr:hypothetical protein [Methanofollis fontis]TAJ44119.1 hypothetical protein CUJ86_08795 [Methanofollis fontis]
MSKTFENLDGTSVAERFASIGIEAGARIDILDLQRLQRRYNFRAAVYFEEEMARKNDLAADDAEYANVPETERPFVSVDAFLSFAREFDPYSFELRLKECPLMIEIIGVGMIGARPHVIGLMPFLDELETFEEPEIHK